MGSNQSSTYSPFTRRNRQPLTEEKRQKRLANRYKYLENTFTYYLLRTSVKAYKSKHAYCGYYDYQGIVNAERSGWKIQTMDELLKMLIFIPFCREYHKTFRHYMNSSEIRYKENSIKVRGNRYSTYDKLSWNDDCWQNGYLFRNEERFFSIPFQTACALIDIMNLEYHLFTNEEWISTDFENILSSFSTVNIPKPLLNLLISWISPYRFIWGFKRFHNENWVEATRYSDRFLFAYSLSNLLVDDDENEKLSTCYIHLL